MANTKINGRKSKKVAVVILLLALFGAVGVGTSLLWKQLKEGNRGQVESREEMRQLLKKYVDADQFDEAFNLLNQALQGEPGDKDLLRELEDILARKQQHDRAQAETAGRDQREFLDSLLRQNAELYNRSAALQQRLEQEEQQRTELEKRRKQMQERIHQGQDALARSGEAATQNSSQDVKNKAAEAKDKALQELELGGESTAAPKLSEEAASWQNENRQQQRKNAGNEVEKLHRALAEARSKDERAIIDSLIYELLAQNPLDSEANTAKAKRIEQQHGDGALKDAESAYRKALIRTPEQWEALAGLARNLDKQNRLEEAVKAYEEALEKPDDPFDSELGYLRGIVLYRLSKYQAAGDSFSEYIGDGGQNLRAYYGLGLSYQQLSRDQEAKKAFLNAIEKGLEHAATYWELSRLELKLGQAKEALEHVNKALALKRDDNRYLQTKGGVLFQLARYGEAAAVYKQADNPDVEKSKRGQVNYNMGLSYYNNAQYPKAETAFGKAVSLDDGKSEYVLGLADAQIALGKNEEVQKTLSLAEKKFPDNVDLLLTQGNIYLKAEEYDLALEAFQKAYDKNPKDRKIINNLGLVYMNTEQFEHSRDFFRKAIEGDPSNSDLWFNLALVDVATEQHNDAIGSLKKTLSLDGKMSQAYYLLIKEYIAASRMERAQDTLDKLRRTDPKYSKIAELEEILSR